MITNTENTLPKGMEILAENIGIVEAKRFIFLIKFGAFRLHEMAEKLFR